MITPLFKSHYSIGKSILTLDAAEEIKPYSPVSIFSLAQQSSLKEIVLVENRIDGFISAYKMSTKLNVKLCFGLKLCVVSDMNDKSETSLANESKIIIFINKTEGYSDLIKIHNRASIDGFYYQPRIDFKTLKSFWSSNLILGLPYFSSFLAQNALKQGNIIPDFPVKPTLFREINSELPFSPIIDNAIDEYTQLTGAEVIESKSIYYHTRADFKPYQVLRCITNRSKFDRPNLDHFASSAFCYESWRELT